jgi:hypothetical protein
MNQDTHKQIIVLLCLLEAVESSEKYWIVDFHDYDIDRLFYNQLSKDELFKILQQFAKEEILDFWAEDEYTERRQVTIFKEKYTKYLKNICGQLLVELDGIIKKQKEELELTYGFLPEKIVNEIIDSKEKLAVILADIDKVDYLTPFKPKIEEVSQYLEITEKVIKNYENIYLNIIKPLKKEGEQGIKATVRWAIFGIIITTLFSFYLSSRSFNKNTKNDIQGKIVNNVANNVDLSQLERKVDFLTKEVMGLNDPFRLSVNSFTLKEFDKQIVFLSQTDTITLEPAYFYDSKIGSNCYSTVELEIYLNNRQFTKQMFNNTFVKKSRVNIQSQVDGNSVPFIEKDTLIFKNHSILIDKIFSIDSQCSPLGDKMNAISIIKLQ